jgi:hypothetical protein
VRGRRDRILAGAGLAAIAVAGAALVMLLWSGAGASEPEPTVSSPAGIDAYADLDRYKVHFGDTVTARVEVTVDRARVDPGSVRVGADFTPWKPAEAPRELRRDGKSTTYLETSYTLRCLESFCTTPEEAATQRFPAARVSYTTVGSGAVSKRTHTLRATWPELLVTARYGPPSAGGASSQPATRWQANLVSLPPATYRLSPWLIVALLLGAAALLAGIPVALLVRSRRRSSQVAAEAPAARRGPVITALEYALALLEDPARVNGSGDQRRALELVADGLVHRGAGALAGTARTLAWSRPVPGIDETRALARRARAALGKEGHAAPAS